MEISIYCTFKIQLGRAQRDTQEVEWNSFWLVLYCLTSVNQQVTNHHCKLRLVGGNSNIFLFSPRKLGKSAILTNIFQRGWLKPPTRNLKYTNFAEILTFEKSRLIAGFPSASFVGARLATGAADWRIERGSNNRHQRLCVIG